MCGTDPACGRAWRTSNAEKENIECGGKAAATAEEGGQICGIGTDRGHVLCELVSPRTHFKGGNSLQMGHFNFSHHRAVEYALNAVNLADLVRPLAFWP